MNEENDKIQLSFATIAFLYRPNPELILTNMSLSCLLVSVCFEIGLNI